MDIYKCPKSETQKNFPSKNFNILNNKLKKILKEIKYNKLNFIFKTPIFFINNKYIMSMNRSKKNGKKVVKKNKTIKKQKGGTPIENIDYKSFIGDIKDKKIICIGENLHGANFSFRIRKKIISSLHKLNKNIIICLEENDEALRNWDTDNFFPMHKSKAFLNFYNFCGKNNIPIFGIDDYETESRNTAMYKNIIKVSKKYPEHQLVFLAFDTHVSFYSDFSKDWMPNYKSYEEREDVGYKLKEHFKDQYSSIGLILKTGKTIGKTDDDHSILVTLDFENTKEILDINEGIYKSNNQDLLYSGAGPYYFNGYNVKFLDYFWVWDYTTPHKLIL